MMINLPIKRFKLKENKVIINNLVVEYEDISEDNREILESLISKGAYGSALLTLNSFYNVKKINEAECSHSEYLSYLKECNNLMKECVVETDKAHNFRPLINLNGFEIMESADHIARGKGDRLLVEDFRGNRVLCEGSEILVTYDVPNEEAALEIANDSVYFDPGEEVLVRDWNGHEYKVTKTKQTPVEKRKEKIDAVKESEGTQCSDIASRKDQSVGKLQRPPRRKRKKEIKEGNKPFIPDKIDTYVSNYNSKTGKKKHAEDFTWQYMAGKVDGMKVKGDKQTHIFNVDSGDYLGTYSDYMKEALEVPRNHGFKGFMMNESGFYTRGNYILIKENGKIKAVRSKGE